jgi:putative transcription factor
MTVCGSCAKLGSASWEMQTPPKPVRRPARRKIILYPRVSVKKPQPPLSQDLELVSDYNLLVRKARERSGLSHEDLGRKISERISVLKKVESGKMVPDNRLATKLEHALKIKLLVPPPSEPNVHPPKVIELRHQTTLGDVAKIKGKKTEASEEREQL